MEYNVVTHELIRLVGYFSHLEFVTLKLEKTLDETNPVDLLD